MRADEEPGSDKVTANTRAFEEIDAQVFAGPGRGATRSEAAASDWWGGPSPAIGEAYRRMFDLVAKHQRAQSNRGAPRPQATRDAPRPTRMASADGTNEVGEAHIATGVDVFSPAASGLL
jgi:hypothetical protein